MDFDDECALVRTAQGDVPLATAVPIPAAAEEPASPATATDHGAEDGDAEDGEDAAAEPQAEDDVPPLDDTTDAFIEDDFREVDGRYDIVPGRESEMDILYDMLSSFNEDSVQIYAGLNRPVTDEAPQDEPAPRPTEISPDDVELEPDEDEPESAPAAAAVEPEQEPAAGAPEEAALEAAEPETEPEVAEPETEPEAGEPLEAEPVQPEPAESEPAESGTQAPTTQAPAPDEPEQLALVEVPDDEAQPAEAKAPAPKPKPRSRRKRATVPSWDEIMFGVPRPPERPKK